MKLSKRIFWLVIFAIAMAYIESAIVVYLREIYYPQGFSFPLVAMKRILFVTEFWREAATIVMLSFAGIITGDSPVRRFAFFLLAFAVWDIFYYIFLYVLIGWPTSILTWDVLFLIPVPWVGPVITPVICSFLMVLLSSLLIYFNRGLNVKQWLLLGSGSLIVIISWILDYINYTRNQNLISESQGNKEVINGFINYVPTSFNWGVYILGIALIGTAITFYYFSGRRSSK